MSESEKTKGALGERRPLRSSHVIPVVQIVLRQNGRHNTAFTVNRTLIDVDWKKASAKLSQSLRDSVRTHFYTVSGDFLTPGR